MTYKEMYMKMHSEMTPEEMDKFIYDHCPTRVGDMEGEDPDYCDGSTAVPEICPKCWDREVPGTEPIKKEKNNSMTKAQMLEEIEKANATIHEMKTQLKNLEKYKAYEDMANEIKAVHTAFMNSGFSDEQAYDMLKTVIGTVVPGVMKGLI